MGVPAPLGVPASGLPASGDVANAVLSGSFVGIGPTAPFAFRGPMNVVIYAGYTDALTTVAGSLNATFANSTSLAVGDAINSTLAPAGAVIGSIVAGGTIALAIPPITVYGLAEPNNSQIRSMHITAGLLNAAVTGPNIPAGDTVSGIIQNALLGNNIVKNIDGIISLSIAPTGYNANNQKAPFVFQQTGQAISLSGTDASALVTGANITYTGSVQLERSFDGGKTWLLCNLGSGGQLAQWSYGTPVSFTFGEPEREVLYRLNCTAYAAGPIYYRISATGQAAESIAVNQLS